MSKEKERVEEVTRIGDAPFQDIHPGPNARSSPVVKGRDLPDHLGIDGKESRWVRCKQCGWILDSSIIARGSGWGNETYQAATGSNYTSNSDPVVTVGCPLCGASEW